MSECALLHFKLDTEPATSKTAPSLPESSTSILYLRSQGESLTIVRFWLWKQILRESLAENWRQDWMSWGNQLSRMMPEEPYPEEMESRLTNEEYKIWKKNTPFLYGKALSCHAHISARPDIMSVHHAIVAPDMIHDSHILAFMRFHETWGSFLRVSMSVSMLSTALWCIHDFCSVINNPVLHLLLCNAIYVSLQ